MKATANFPMSLISCKVTTVNGLKILLRVNFIFLCSVSNIRGENKSRNHDLITQRKSFLKEIYDLK